jgi:23S rRNA (adenine2503-C2)-methyltransferase
LKEGRDLSRANWLPENRESLYYWMPRMPVQTELLSLSNQELDELVKKLGEPAYRARQLADAVFRQRRETLEMVPNLPSALKMRLAEQDVSTGFPRIEQKFTSIDGTVRYLIAFSDNQTVETVWMPDGDLGEAGDGSEAGTEELKDLGVPVERRPEKSFGNSDGQPEKLNPETPIASLQSPSRKRNRQNSIATPPDKRFSRSTICISSQVGCAVNCQFCLTALLGMKRNLSPGEIVGQVLAVLRDHDVDLERERMNIVFMGMGEPFLNYDNFIKAVRLLVEEVHFPESRMTVSTSGIVPRIADLGREPIRPKLAISLNAPNDEIRERIMPITRKWNTQALLDAARAFPLRPRERLTFEYVLLNGVNDAPEHAREVVNQVRDIRCKVNLIAFNPGPEVPFTMPGEDRVLSFQQTLIDSDVPAFIRRPRGRDIYAACGQLKRTVS